MRLLYNPEKSGYYHCGESANDGINEETNMATSWKCTTENCPGTLAQLTFFEPRLLEQYIDAADGKIKTHDDYAIDDNPAWFECSLCGQRYEADETDDEDSLVDLWVSESNALAHEVQQQKIKDATAKRRATLVEKRRQQYETDTGFRKPQ
jgi:hypothetical protein